MFYKIIKKIKDDNFVKNAMSLMSGTVIAQLIVFGISPFLARLYSPADFAVLSIFLSLSGLLATIATGRYELAIMLPTQKKDAVNLLRLSLIITFFVSITALLVFVIFNSEITNYTNNSRISIWLYFIPLSIFFSGIYQAFTYWLNRLGKYKDLSITRGSQSGFIGLSQIILSFFTKSGLIIGNLIGHFLTVVLISYKAIKNGKGIFDFKQFNFLEIKLIAKKYKEFPTINMGHAFFDIARDSIAIILISRYFNEDTLGNFALTIRLLKTPIIFIGSSIGQVFFKEAKGYIENSNLFKRTIKLTAINTAIAIPIFVVLFIIAPDFFVIFFGDQWYNAGEFARYLSVFYLFNFLASPISVIPILLRKQGKFFILNLIRGILYIGVFLVCGYLSLSIETTLIYLSIIMSIFIAIIIAWIVYIAYLSDKKVIKVE